MGISSSALSGLAQSYLANKQRQQQSGQELQNLIIKSIIEQRIKMQDPYYQLQALMLAKYMPDLLGRGETGAMPQPNINFGGINRATNQPINRMQQYRMKPTFTFGKEGLNIGLSQEEDPEYKRQMAIGEETGKVEARKIAEANVARKIYRKDLDNFFIVDDVLHRARGSGGLERFKAGASMLARGVVQKDVLGQATATHGAIRKRLRVQLVRAAGDVGNINIVEQKAAEQMIPTEWDAFQTAEIKRAYLKELGRAIDNNDGNAVKDIINRFMETEAYQQPMQNNQTIPKYNPQYQKLQKNTRTGEYRVVPKNMR